MPSDSCAGSPIGRWTFDDHSASELALVVRDRTYEFTDFDEPEPSGQLRARYRVNGE